MCCGFVDWLMFIDTLVGCRYCIQHVVGDKCKIVSQMIDIGVKSWYQKLGAKLVLLIDDCDT